MKSNELKNQYCRYCDNCFMYDYRYATEQCRCVWKGNFTGKQAEKANKCKHYVFNPTDALRRKGMNRLA